ncbi:MAG TPA: glutathione S-transferase family protein [Kofleriaceae bacterium]
MKLHYGSLSSNSRRARITAKLLGINLEEVAVDLREPSNRAELVKINPNSKVPVLVDGTFVLWESIAIMQYFCDLTPGQTLYPTEPRARAVVNRWLSWTQAHWNPAIGHISFENVWKKFATGEGPDAANVKRNEAFLAQFATVLEDHLASRTWLTGGTMTLADIAVGTPLMMTKLGRLPLQPYRQIQAWFERIRDLPEWKATEPPQLAQLEAQFANQAIPEARQPRPEA